MRTADAITKAQGGILPALIAASLGSTAGAARTQEQVLADAWTHHGPFIAIGDPAETLPDLGAARLYPGSENWQSVVSDLMVRARFVIIRPGAGQGLRWEIEQVMSLVPAERVVFWLPGAARDDRDPLQLEDNLRTLLGSKLPDSLPSRGPGASFLCCLFRDQRG